MLARANRISVDQDIVELDEQGATRVEFPEGRVFELASDCVRYRLGCVEGPAWADAVGIGGGQISRVEAVRQAIARAGEGGKGAVLASAIGRVYAAPGGRASEEVAQSPPDPAKLRFNDRYTVEAFSRIVRSYVCKFFSRESQIRDVTQDALLELLVKLDDGERPESSVFWALTAADNAVLRELRRLRHRVIEYESSLHGERDEPDPLALLDAREDLRRINGLLAEAEEGPYRALTGALEGNNHNELGRALGVSPGTARMTLAQARAELSTRFTAQQKLDELIAQAKRAGLIDSEQDS